MSISTATVNAYYASTTDQENLIHTFYRKEKVWNAETKVNEVKGLPILVITSEPREFVKNANYVLVGGFHTSQHDTLVLYPFKVFEVGGDVEVNTVSFIGRVGQDPTTHYSDSGSMSVHCTLAHAEYLGGVNYSGKDGEAKTVWTKISFIPKKGENKKGTIFLDHLDKIAKAGGKKPLVGINGAFHVETYVDKNSDNATFGETRFSPKVLVNSIEFIANVYDDRSSQPRAKADLTSLKLDPKTVAAIDSVPF